MGRVFIDNNIWASGQNYNFLKNSPTHQQHCHAAHPQGLPRNRQRAEAEKAGRAEPAIPGATKKLVLVLPFVILMGIVQVNCHCTKHVPTYFIFLKYILNGIL